MRDHPASYPYAEIDGYLLPIYYVYDFFFTPSRVQAHITIYETRLLTGNAAQWSQDAPRPRDRGSGRSLHRRQTCPGRCGPRSSAWSYGSRSRFLRGRWRITTYKTLRDKSYFLKFFVFFFYYLNVSTTTTSGAADAVGP